MKKLLAIVLILAIAVSLCACGKVNQTMELINAIGTVTLDSEAAITAAEKSYARLKEDQQLQVENHAALQEARSTYDRITNVANLIDSIGEVTLESEAAIVAAEEAYALLKENQQLQVKNYAALQEARSTYDRINVANLIDSVGEVTLESEAAIVAAEEAYAALSAADQATIENYDLLPAARAAYEDAKFEAFVDSIAVEWVSELFDDHSIVLTKSNSYSPTSWIGAWKQVTADGDVNTGTWKVDRKAGTLTLKLSDSGNNYGSTMICRLIEEDGFIKLVTAPSPMWFNYNAACYVRLEDYEAAFEKKFLAVELNGENYTEYLEGPVQVGYALGKNGEPNVNKPAYIMKSKLYDQGYVYIDTSDDFVVEIIREEVRNGTVIAENSNPVKWHLFMPHYGFVLTEDWTELPVRLGEKTTGTVYFIKAEYVIKNYHNTKYNSTYVLTTSGALYDTCFYEEHSFNYEDYLR